MIRKFSSTSLTIVILTVFGVGLNYPVLARVVNLNKNTLQGNQLIASLPSISCNLQLTANTEYSCVVPGADSGAIFSLNNAPIGMVIQPKSGYLHWTPTSNQTGTHNVDIVRQVNGQDTVTSIAFNVAAGNATAPAGIYVAPNGQDNAAGTVSAPLLSLHKAAQQAEAGDTIYLRGGTYTNRGFGNADFTNRSSNLARITESGTASQWITIRPYGNEYVKLKSDVNGIVFKGASYWRVQGLELEGISQQLNYSIALSLWWEESKASNKIKGRGIAMNTSHNIEISDTIINNFPGAGVSNNGGANITLKDSIIYHNAWWSTAGTHGFANSKPATNDNNNSSSYKMTMTDNLVFGNQSSIVSHVFSKGFVKLEIDEGNGLHMQNTEGNFVGRFLARNNLLIYNGKAGLGLNTIANSTIQNNSFYQNAQAVESNGELSLQPPTEPNYQPNDISKNLFHPLSERVTIKDFDKNNLYRGISDNYGVPAQDANALAGRVKSVNSVFTAPENFDFSRSSLVPSGYGVPQATLDNFNAKLKEYGITIASAPTQISHSYLKKMKLDILKTWPAPNPNDTIPDNLYLIDGDTKHCYTYEDRLMYPDPPKTVIPECK